MLQVRKQYGPLKAKGMLFIQAIKSQRSRQTPYLRGNASRSLYNPVLRSYPSASAAAAAAALFFSLRWRRLSYNPATQGAIVVTSGVLAFAS